MERYNGDIHVRHSSACGLLLGDFNSGDCVHSYPCDIRPPQPYRKLEAPNQVLPIHPDREKKVHPFVRRVKLATQIEMRHRMHFRQRGSQYAQSIRLGLDLRRARHLTPREATLYSGRRQKGSLARQPTPEALERRNTAEIAAGCPEDCHPNLDCLSVIPAPSHRFSEPISPLGSSICGAPDGFAQYHSCCSTGAPSLTPIECG